MRPKNNEIQSDQDLQAALDRAEALAGCIKNSPEQRELAAIAAAVERYEQAVAAERKIPKRVQGALHPETRAPRFGGAGPVPDAGPKDNRRQFRLELA